MLSELRELQESDVRNERVAAAMQLIAWEATLLDDQDYNSWDSLWASEQSRYIIPIDRDSTDYDSRLNYVNDDAEMRRLRVERMAGGFAHAANTTGPIARTLGRSIVLSNDDEGVVIRSSQIVVLMRRQEQQIWAADVVHTIVFEDGQPKIQKKVVLLIDSELPVRSCGFLL